MKNRKHQDTGRSELTPAATNQATQSNQSDAAAIPQHIERLRAAFGVDISSGTAEKQLTRLFEVQPELGERLRQDGHDESAGFCDGYLLAHYRRMQEVSIAPPIATDQMLFTYEQWVEAELESDSPERSPLFQYVYQSCGAPSPSYEQTLRRARTHRSIVKFFTACACLSEMRSYWAPLFEVPPMVQASVDGEWIVEFAPLREMLLSYGGKYFQPVAQLAQHFPPIFIRQLCTLGRLFRGPGASPVSPNEAICQADAYALAARNDLEVWTGFALGVDLWQLHSWIVRDNTLLDADRPRALYFGFRVNASLRPFVPQVRHAHVTTAPCSFCY
jgi:hypothetical protein